MCVCVCVGGGCESAFVSRHLYLPDWETSHVLILTDTYAAESNSVTINCILHTCVSPPVTYQNVLC